MDRRTSLCWLRPWTLSLPLATPTLLLGLMAGLALVLAAVGIYGVLSTVAVGVVLGILGAVGLTRLLSHLLVYVSALDPVAFAAAPVLLLAVSLASIWLPAMRASRVDPMVALRSE